MRSTSFAALCLAATAVQAAAQDKKVPIVELAPAAARTTDKIAGILNVRQLSDKRLLVNDAGSRRVLLFDSTLTHSTVVIDSVAGAPNSYGPFGSPLLAYFGDSSLFVDRNSQSFLVLDQNGKVARVMAPPRPQDFAALSGSQSAIDNKGRLVYSGGLTIRNNAAGRGNVPGNPVPGTAGAPQIPTIPDSAPVLRADFESRATDTVGRVKLPGG
ncbi:MAG TPA: hypothetical protein VE967_08635, partial [Gemmatimonadaceae bacterium]|nr:hypothetical protein [Gemmatimonadaceae bacterium]